MKRKAIFNFSLFLSWAEILTLKGKLSQTSTLPDCPCFSSSVIKNPFIFNWLDKFYLFHEAWVCHSNSQRYFSFLNSSSLVIFPILTWTSVWMVCIKLLSGGTHCCWCSVTQSFPALCDPMDCSMPKFTSIESMILSNHLIFCHPLLLLPPIFPSTKVFSNESALCISGQSIGASASASVLPMNIQGWFPLEVIGLISLLFKWFSRVFSNTTVQKTWKDV